MENTAKQEAIRKAYGEYWDKMSTELQAIALRSDGWILMRDCIKELGKDFSLSQHLSTEPHFNSSKQRPKSLQGIKNNNGWIRIEGEEDLPKDSFNYYAFCSNGSVMTFNDFEYYKKYIIPELKVTHYQPIVKPEKPIY